MGFPSGYKMLQGSNSCPVEDSVLVDHTEVIQRSSGGHMTGPAYDWCLHLLRIFAWGAQGRIQWSHCISHSNYT